MTGTRTLIAYATKYGTTKEIAEEIQDILTENGIESDLINVMETGSIDTYDAVIIGSPVYMGKMLIEARDFCQKYMQFLAEKWVAIFVDGVSCCPPGEEAERTLIAAIDEMKDYVKPAVKKVFAGSLDPSVLIEADAQIADMVHPPVGDFRDHEAIRTWAREIASAILENNNSI
ncbi:flavodoxin domain-containing protein [Methanogenium organophilum]|uniref:Flavodoxin domain-containing protein n=1 Tax=Methanogenium organophilum TaxID=2199 RepID=A0A9X9S4B0_METOG|nr:flavodoxin domain-containing protein [Methanogenium organophilum]WAI00650.1 flavodoxin domain-containing protein [Methanogenium organophilum]